MNALLLAYSSTLSTATLAMLLHVLLPAVTIVFDAVVVLTHKLPEANENLTYPT